MNLFSGLLLAHLLYDFHWQGPFISENKGKHPFLLFVHSLTWALLLTAVLWWFDEATPFKFAFLLATHFFVDGWKSRLPRTDSYFWAIYVDQGLHFLTLLVVMII